MVLWQQKSAGTNIYAHPHYFKYLKPQSFITFFIFVHYRKIRLHFFHRVHSKHCRTRELSILEVYGSVCDFALPPLLVCDLLKKNVFSGGPGGWTKYFTNAVGLQSLHTLFTWSMSFVSLSDYCNINKHLLQDWTEAVKNSIMHSSSFRWRLDKIKMFKLKGYLRSIEVGLCENVMNN